MSGLLQKIANAFARRYQPTATERWCAAHFQEKSRRLKPPGETAPLVMIEGADDPFFFALLGQIILNLRTVRNVRVGLWISHSLNASASQSLSYLIAGRLDGWLISRLKWKKLYAAISDARGERADRLRAPWRELSWWRRAWRLFRGLENKDQLAALTVRGILIGDLVIDSYLRFKPAAELNLRDPYLLLVLRQAVKDVDTLFDYLERTRPALYLATYASYIQHGIPARVAVALGITTWTFANAQEFGTRLTPDHLVHTKRVADYAADFSKLADPADKIAKAERDLGGRVTGTADTMTANQRSAYEVRTREVPDVRGAAIVFLHDFFDSAHIYRWLVFHDFWEWAGATIENLQAAGLPFFLKPHPNQRAESNAELERLRKKYPAARILSADVSNRQLVEGGMACAVTVYGSVAAEMAYLGIPSISCGDSPHASFDSFHLATNKEDYRALLQRFSDLPRDPERMRRQASAFYYMHNLNLRPDEQMLRDGLIAFYLALQDQEAGRGAPGEMQRLFGNLENSPGFHRFVDDLAANLSPAAPQ